MVSSILGDRSGDRGEDACVGVLFFDGEVVAATASSGVAVLDIPNRHLVIIPWTAVIDLFTYRPIHC